MMNIIKPFVFSTMLSILATTAGNASGINTVFDYYEVAFDSLIKAGDKAAITEFQNLVSNISTKVEVIQEDVGDFKRGNPTYVQNIVDGILGDNIDLNTGGQGYLPKWGVISNGLKTVVTAKGFVDVATKIRDFNISKRKWNRLAKEIANMSARGDANVINWLITISKASYHGGASLLNLSGLGDEAKRSIELILVNRNRGEVQDIIEALQQDSANFAVNELKELLLNEGGKKVIVQHLVIDYLANESVNRVGIKDLQSQDLYSVKFVNGLFRNSYKSTVESGNVLYKEYSAPEENEYIFTEPKPNSNQSEKQATTGKGSLLQETSTEQFDNSDFTNEEIVLYNQEPESPNQIESTPQIENPNDNNNFPFLGFIAGKIEGSASLFTGNLYTGRADGGDAPIGSRGEARINRNGINTFYSDNLEPSIRVRINESESADGFRYSDWGEWNGSGVTVNNFSGARAERGYYVIGRSTNSRDLPRAGSAEYTGEVRAIAFSGENIGGTVDLTANFSDRNVRARMGLTRENGSRWVTVQTGNMSYENALNRDFELTFGTGNATVFDASGNRISGAGANVRGMFAGPAGEEIIGDFAVGGVPDDVGGVDGVYRAQRGDTIFNAHPPSIGGGPVVLPDIGETPF